MKEDETFKENLDPAFPQELAWAITGLTYLTSDEHWPAFYEFLKGQGGFVDPTVESAEMKEVAEFAASRLHSIAHTMVERRRALQELPPFLRQMMGIPVDDSEVDDDPEFTEEERPGHYL